MKNRALGMLKLTTEKHEASRGLSATAELVVLSRVSILTRDIDTANLSVCLSVTFQYQMKTA